MDDDKKPIVKPLVNNNIIRIEENKRNSLKSFLEDFLRKEMMKDLTNTKENDPLIGQISDRVNNKPKEEEDAEDDLTLSQCLKEINEPEPGVESEAEPETDRKPDPDVLLNVKQEMIDHDKDDFITSNQWGRRANEDAAAVAHFSRDLHPNEDFSRVKVKEEPIEDPEGNDDSHDQAISDPTNAEDNEAFQTPKNSKTNKTGGVSTGRISSRRSRLSSRKIELNNRKITEFFPITSKSKNSMSTNTPKGKSADAENLFILSAVQGDGNFCILCQKKFSASYLKTHLINKHGVSKDIFPSGRKIKKENTEIIVKNED